MWRDFPPFFWGFEVAIGGMEWMPRVGDKPPDHMILSMSEMCAISMSTSFNLVSLFPKSFLTAISIRPQLLGVSA